MPIANACHSGSELANWKNLLGIDVTAHILSTSMELRTGGTKADEEIESHATTLERRSHDLGHLEALITAHTERLPAGKIRVLEQWIKDGAKKG